MNPHPFPHDVIDNFLHAELADVIAKELENSDTSQWPTDEHSEQHLKRFATGALVPLETATVLHWFNDPAVIKGLMEPLTGIDGLIADHRFIGGGVHVTDPGGRLGIHADFNLHPETGLHRRVNALLYLNRDWKEEWGGNLELWEQDMSHLAKSISPIHNRLVIFNITDTAFHGMPRPLACPSNRKRFSLALYYYSEDRPEEEKAPFHLAKWQSSDA